MNLLGLSQSSAGLGGSHIGLRSLSACGRQSILQLVQALCGSPALRQALLQQRLHLGKAGRQRVPLLSKLMALPFPCLHLSMQ